ncbi:hypothetical protein ACFY7C_19520 [Streptomyces sp. NPDC012769]|uniref:DUF7178 family protein n=1 Tax=Streptomyces sp. NPDC012769 TaxID=3364848 RepID=UPI0036A5614E
MIPVSPSESTRRRYVRNIVKTYRQATEDQVVRGKAWYRTAHQLADMMSGGDVRAGAGVIAALSANKAWDMNRRLAQDAFAGRLHGHVGDALTKAAKIMAGADPAEVLPMDIKTGNFYRCILDPEDPEAVCIDRHAHDVALGTPKGNADRGLSSKGRYAALSLAYRNAAAILGVLPSQVQAVTWVVWTESLAGVKRRPTLERYSHNV